MRKLLVLVLMGSAWSLTAMTVFAQGAGAPAANALQDAAPAALAAAGASSRTIGDVLQLLDSLKADSAAGESLKRLTLQAPPASNDPAVLAGFFRRRGAAFAAMGSVQDQLKDYREALRVTRRQDLPVLGEAAVAEFNAGNHLVGIELLEALAKFSGGALPAITVLAGYQALIGDFAKANRYLGLAEADVARQRRSGTDWSLWQYERQQNVARARYWVFGAQGRFADAEAAARECIDALEKDFEPATLKLKRGYTGLSASFMRATYANDEGRLARLLMLQGKLTEAEIWARRSLVHHVENGSRLDLQVARSVLVIAQVLDEQGRLVESEMLARRAIDIFESVQAQPHSVLFNEARLERANGLAAMGLWNEALAEYTRRRDGLAGDPEYSQRVGAEQLGWAIALLRSGKPQEAKAMLELLEARLATRYGADHYDVAEVQGFMGIAQIELGHKAQAVADFRKSLAGLFARRSAADQARSPAKALRLNMIVEAYIGVLHDIRGTAIEADARIDAGAEAFTMADAVRGQSTQRSMAAAGARAGAAGDPVLGALIRKEQDLANESDSLLEILLRLSESPSAQQMPGVVAQMRGRVDAIAKERKIAAAQIERGFPQYANLIQPRLVTLKEVQGQLASGEVLVSIFPGTSRTYVWAVAKEGQPRFHASLVTAGQLAQKVTALRTALDVGDVPVSLFPVFDVESAHALYRELLLPVREAWKDAKSMLVTTSGPLAQIPFALLPTEPTGFESGPVAFARYRTVPWLIKQIAIAQLPSANALVSLRSMPASSRTRRAFAGFGDPVFDSRLAVAANAQTGSRDPKRLSVRNLMFPRVTEDAIRRNQTLNAIPYSQLAPLPDTREEVLAIARALNANIDSDVFLGSNASKAQLRGADLASRRIIAFSTHGLLPGDFPGVDQPALALSAPPDGSAENEPRKALLTLDDILALKLDADWVVLSACNTAAGDGKGSEAISGLGRAFFYAGSRALLATHWPVESYSARLLVAGIFERYAADASLSRTEALRASMLALMNGAAGQGGGTAPDTYAHPMFWAPYALVGDSGR